MEIKEKIQKEINFLTNQLVNAYVQKESNEKTISNTKIAIAAKQEDVQIINQQEAELAAKLEAEKKSKKDKKK